MQTIQVSYSTMQFVVLLSSLRISVPKNSSQFRFHKWQRILQSPTLSTTLRWNITGQTMFFHVNLIRWNLVSEHGGIQSLWCVIMTGGCYKRPHISTLHQQEQIERIVLHKFVESNWKTCLWSIFCRTIRSMNCTAGAIFYSSLPVTSRRSPAPFEWYHQL